MENQAVCFQTKINPQMLCGYDKKQYEKFVGQLTQFIKEAFVENGITTFITGGEEGLDHLAFWSINRLKKDFPEIKNNLCLRGKYQKNDLPKKGLFSQSEFQKMCALADDINYIDSDDLAFDTVMRDARMMDRSDVIVTIGTEFEPHTYRKKKNKDDSYTYITDPNMSFIQSSCFRGSEGQPIEPRHDIYYLRYKKEDEGMNIIKIVRYSPKITMEINSYEDAKENWRNINKSLEELGIYKKSVSSTLWDYDSEKIELEEDLDER